MEFIGRFLFGIVILLLLGWLWSFFFDLVTGIVQLVAYGLARLLRKVFGVSGYWATGAAGALVGALVGRTATVSLFWISVFWYAFLHPTAAWVSEGAAALAGVALFAVWMPSVFLLGLFVDPDELT